MFNQAIVPKGLSLTKIIGGLSKTLQIANQVIPLYQKAKPIITNARSIFSTIKDITKNNSSNPKSNDSVKVIDAKDIKINNLKKESLSNSPTFFL